MEGDPKLRKLLKDRGCSLTGPRILVFDALKNAEGPVSVSKLAKSLQAIDKVSVYRTINLFESAGIINRVWTGFKSKVELSEEFSPHHHHFTCINCGVIISLENEELETSLNKLEIYNGFKLTYHSVELSGYCKLCKGKMRESGLENNIVV